MPPRPPRNHAAALRVGDRDKIVPGRNVAEIEVITRSRVAGGHLVMRPVLQIDGILVDVYGRRVLDLDRPNGKLVTLGIAGQRQPNGRAQHCRGLQR